MNIRITGGALALPLLALALPVCAQDDATNSAAETIVVEEQLLHPAAGLMNEHMHDGGELMLGLRYERTSYSGLNQRGDQTIADAEVLAAGYTVRAQSMVMDMVMLDIMFAPNDDLTLMVMPHYMWHSMEMLGIDPASGMGGMTMGHGLPFGVVHSHGAEGFGDTLVSASYRLARAPGVAAHATLGLWVPTGAVDLTNANGSFVHYGMQPGSGTWDVEPAVTVSGRSGGMGWGAQAAYKWRTDDDNASGFAFGDRARGSGWASYVLTPSLGATARLEYVHEGAILGHYNGTHSHASPPDAQGNYGGDTVTAGVGLNWLLPVAGRNRPQLGVEVGLPLYQNLNGFQLPQQWRMSVALSQTF